MENVLKSEEGVLRWKELMNQEAKKGHYRWDVYILVLIENYRENQKDCVWL